MKRKLTLSLITGLALAGAVCASTAGAACTPTGFIRDGMNLTAKVIADGDISGQTIDAGVCNIGIYYGPGTSGTVESSEVFGANYFGIVVTGEDSLLNVGTTSVDVKNSSIHNIGDKPTFTGSQHGVAVYYYAVSDDASATGASPAMRSPSIKKAGSSRTARMPRFRSAKIPSWETGQSPTSRRTGSRSAAAAPA